MFETAPTTRRVFLRRAAAAAFLATLKAAPAGAIRPLRRRRLAAREPWADIHQLADGAWAVISKPLEDRTTLCNGGIIAGRDTVLVIESFASPRGAAWVAERARELTGRAPDLVLLTHHHGDHTAGLAGFAPGTAVLTTEQARARIREQDARRDPDPAKSALLGTAELVAAERTIDLGGVSVRVVPRSGHTASDVTVHLDGITFAGDLVWNAMFPNYVDAIPSQLRASVAKLSASQTTIVPGHGPIGDEQAFARYVALIHFIEDSAREAARRGLEAAEAAEALPLPASYDDFYKFSPRYYETALAAWLRELRAG